MYLFSRSTVISSPDAIPWAVGMAEHAKRASGLEVGLWAQIWSPEVGRISWTTFVPNLAILATAGDAFNADSAMAAEATKGAAFTNGTMDDALFSIVHGDLDPNAPQAEYVSSVRAVCANGAVAKGMTAGIEIAQRAEKITDVRTMFVANVTGAYGGVGWLTGYPTIEALEAANQAIESDEDLAKFVDKSGSAYASDTDATVSLIFRRLA